VSIGTIIVIPASETSATRVITPVGDNRIEGDETVMITKLCQPVDKSGSPVLLKGPNAGDPVLLEPAAIRHDDDYLVCYQAKPAGKRVLQTECVPTDPADKGTKIVPKPPKHTPVRGIRVATQLGGLQVDTKKELELCIPRASQ
jgi:hypothetical protein